ncbi:hypothetical protein ACH4PU_33345 [Streptomyces sp. NPDC021100]|uniref:hypothetical protein n=1 Tax=Streptomyces sp. NPDC021100 TaxID=3365114 RepID=UPI0037A4696C
MNTPVLRRVLTAFAALALTTGTTVIAAPPSAYAAKPKSCRQLAQEAEKALNLAIIKPNEERIGRAGSAIAQGMAGCEGDFKNALCIAYGFAHQAFMAEDNPETAKERLQEAHYFVRKVIDGDGYPDPRACRASDESD